MNRSLYSTVAALPLVLLPLGKATAAVIYETALTSVESTSGIMPVVLGDGSLSDESFVIFQNGTVGEGISRSLATSDPTGAAAWLASLPADRDYSVAGLVMQGMESNPDLIRDLLELWQYNPDRTEVIDTGRGRGRENESSDRENALNWLNNDPSLALDPAFGSGSLATAVPETSTLFLGALGILGLLRRRRS